MPSVNSSSMPKVLDSSTVTVPSLPTLSMASASTSPMAVSAAEMEATWAISVLRVDLLGLLLDGLDGGGDRLVDALLRPSGLAPAATLRRPSWIRAWASTVAVVVPSPATSLVLVATSFTSWAPMFSKGSSSSTSRAMDTPSLVMVGAPNFFSMTTLRPFGPRVTLTVSASLFDAGLEAAAGGLVELQDLGHYLLTLARTSRLERISRSSPSTVISVPPYLE